MNLNTKMAALLAKEQKGVAIWAIILGISLVIILGVAFAAGSTTGKSDLAQQKRAESLAATVLQQGFAVETAISIALAEGKT